MIKLWITESITCAFPDAASDLVKHMYRFDGILLDLEDQELSFDEYMKLTSSPNLNKIRFDNVAVKNSNGDFVSTHSYFEHLREVRDLTM